MSSGVRLFLSILFLVVGVLGLAMSMSRDYRGTPDGRDLIIIGAACIPLGVLFLVLAVRKRSVRSGPMEGTAHSPQSHGNGDTNQQPQEPVEGAPIPAPPSKRVPFATRFLRGLCIVWFVLGVWLTTLALCSLAIDRQSLRLEYICGVPGLLFIVFSIFFVRRLSVGICRQEAPKTTSYDGWLIGIGMAAVVIWIRAIPDIQGPALVWQVTGLFGLIGAIAVLFKSRLFLFRNYAVAGIAIGSCMGTSLYPALTIQAWEARSLDRTHQFAGAIDDCRGLATESQFFAAVVREADFVPDRTSGGGALVLIAGEPVLRVPLIIKLLGLAGSHRAAMERLALRVHPWESIMSKPLLAVDPGSIGHIVIVATPGWEPKSPSLARKVEEERGLPVLIVSWPDKRIVGTARISVTLSKPVSDAWGAVSVNRAFASQLEQIIGGSR